MASGVYIHIPFCEHICHYCDFNKVFLKGQPVNEYLNSLEEEIQQTLERYPSNDIRSIFVGGGTPTSINIKQLERLLESINRYINPVNDKLEYTFEANPGETLTKEKIKLLYDAGVNRISFGVQSFDNKILQQIGRAHRKEDIFKSVDWAKEIGFNNVNLDLMYSLPGQTISQVDETLQEAFSLNVDHFSAYSLIVEPKTVFFNLQKKGKLHLPSQEEEVKMFEHVIQQMKKHGYNQYEISNFAKPGMESVHNLTYWNNEEYYGFGAGAHSYIDGKRITNAGPLNKYITEVARHGQGETESHEVTQQEKMEEEMFLGLRKIKGVSKGAFFNKFNEDIHDRFHSQIIEQQRKGLLEEDEHYIRLTHRGMLLGNEVFQAFI
ncbi:radical SAM family heme chaperone HemW [Bacillus sp. SM2101]|uniref:radical SAM family heme chaperone HemW n=1 Tax=Bacillus sp. SM2101 TaxID=2805366 RepID=UPI001BDDD055